MFDTKAQLDFDPRILSGRRELIAEGEHCLPHAHCGMCMYIHVWIYVGANMSVHRLMLVVFLNHYSPLFFDTDLSLKPRPH